MRVEKKYPIEIELTNICGLKCEYCINKNILNKGFMDEFLFLDILDFVYKNQNDILYLNLSGVGDIFLHPKINIFLIYILKKFRDTNFKILIATKGNYLKSSTFKILSNFSKNNIELVLSFGIFSMNQSLHDGFVGKDGALNQTIKKIYEARGYGIDFSLEMVFSSYSVDFIDKYNIFCQRLGIPPTIHSLHNFGGRIDLSREVTLKDIKYSCSFDYDNSSVNIFYKNFSKCNFIPFIDYSGNFYLCSLDAHSGNTLFAFDSIKHINYINLLEKFLKYMGSNCKKCSLNKKYVG